MSWLYLITCTFTLAKTLRDRREGRIWPKPAYGPNPLRNEERTMETDHCTDHRHRAGHQRRFPAPGARAKQASVGLSLPVASVVGVASVAAAGVCAVNAAPLVLSAAGAVFTIKAVEVSARGTVYVLERASDRARVSVEVLGRGVGAASLAVGTGVAVSVIGAGLVLKTLRARRLPSFPTRWGARCCNERLTF